MDHQQVGPTCMEIGSKEIHILPLEDSGLDDKTQQVPSGVLDVTQSSDNSLRQSLLAVLVCPLFCLLVGKKGPIRTTCVYQIPGQKGQMVDYLLPMVIMRSINEMVTCKQQLSGL